MFIDSHCHLQLCYPDKETFSHEVSRISSQLLYFVDISTNAVEFLNLAQYAMPAGMLRSFGLGPEDALAYSPEAGKEFDRIAGEHTLNAVGEAGLDYHWDYGTPYLQEALFRAQVEASIRLEKPLIVHSRDAFPDTCRILSGYSFKKDVIIHCFGYGLSEAYEFLSLGFFISFAGNLTYKGAGQLREAALAVPADRILLETDSPYLAPAPLRGTVNNPLNVIHIYRFLAELKNIEQAELEKAIEMNFRKIYSL